QQAIRAFSPTVSGAFSIDLKENAESIPCITEINAGRFFIGMTAFDQVSQHNVSVVYVRLALHEPFDLPDEYVTVPDHYVVRDLDTMPGVFSADELFVDVNPWGADAPNHTNQRRAARLAAKRATHRRSPLTRRI
ncbi:MAG: hypothetical protein ACREJ6_09755, partial [Candidatus Methylomirabilis sp.]